MSGVTKRHIDSHDALRALVALVPTAPVDWTRADDYAPGHYCEACQVDYDACPRTPGDHDSCPTLCATCREAAGFCCASCADDMPDAQHADVLCAPCHNEATREARS